MSTLNTIDTKKSGGFRRGDVAMMQSKKEKTEIVKVQNDLTDWFRYNRASRQWFRVVLRGGDDEFKTEVLLPLGPAGSYTHPEANWDDIKESRLFATTEFGSRIEYSHGIPQALYDEMVRVLGREHAEFLFNFDFQRYARRGLVFEVIKYRAYDTFVQSVPGVYVSGGKTPNRLHSMLLGRLKPETKAEFAALCAIPEVSL